MHFSAVAPQCRWQRHPDGLPVHHGPWHVDHPVGDEPLQGSIHRLQQLGNDSGIWSVTIGEERRVDPAPIIHTDMKLFALPTLFLAVLLAVPLAFSADLQSGAVDDEGDGYSRPGALWELDVERLVSPAEGAPG